MYLRYAWPAAQWGSMHVAGSAAAAYRSAIESPENPEEKLIESRFNALSLPFRTAEASGTDIIEPREL
jgi:acetyl-CoA carboxylase carboxyltransferase component